MKKRIEVTAAVLVRDGKVLGARRGEQMSLAGFWEFPGGKIEPGELPQQALTREIREELDTDIEVGDLIGTVEYDYPTFHLSMDCFWCTVVNGNLILKEAQEARWLGKSEIYSVQWLPADITIIDRIVKQLN